ncbi:hypothetical protein G7Y89_g1166 [Cudoniella acicularis]|uniref:Apple domain-containing protein n=1 Tax=Cudoniella acicularis TaxID=354080 RepID=A0A8H4W9T1_9HELO|nr:hypothetical protein G7Y89_g1166 [Cudoniella acicularis]
MMLPIVFLLFLGIEGGVHARKDAKFRNEPRQLDFDRSSWTFAFTCTSSTGYWSGGPSAVASAMLNPPKSVSFDAYHFCSSIMQLTWGTTTTESGTSTITSSVQTVVESTKTISGSPATKTAAPIITPGPLRERAIDSGGVPDYLDSYYLGNIDWACSCIITSASPVVWVTITKTAPDLAYTTTTVTQTSTHVNTVIGVANARKDGKLRNEQRFNPERPVWTIDATYTLSNIAAASSAMLHPPSPTTFDACHFCSSLFQITVARTTTITPVGPPTGTSTIKASVQAVVTDTTTEHEYVPFVPAKIRSSNSEKLYWTIPALAWEDFTISMLQNDTSGTDCQQICLKNADCKAFQVFDARLTIDDNADFYAYCDSRSELRDGLFGSGVDYGKSVPRRKTRFSSYRRNLMRSPSLPGMELTLFFLAAFRGLSGLVKAQNSTNFNTTLNSTFSTTSPRNVRIDTGTHGSKVEKFHYYYDQWPIGLAISRTGRVFICYTRGTYAYMFGEVINTTVEAAYPSLELNTPPGGLYNISNGIQFGNNDPNTFISVQALYITPDSTLWVLDTGHPTINESQALSMPYAAPGGPKLVSTNLSNNSISRTYTLPPTVHYPDSYMNDKGSPLEFQQEGLDGAELITGMVPIFSLYHPQLKCGDSSTILQTTPYVRDPRIIWPDSANVGFDGYIYFNINQLPYQPDWNDGIDGRQYPGLVLRTNYFFLALRMLCRPSIMDRQYWIQAEESDKCNGSPCARAKPICFANKTSVAMDFIRRRSLAPPVKRKAYKISTLNDAFSLPFSPLLFINLELVKGAKLGLLLGIFSSLLFISGLTPTATLSIVPKSREFNVTDSDTYDIGSIPVPDYNSSIRRSIREQHTDSTTQPSPEMFKIASQTAPIILHGNDDGYNGASAKVDPARNWEATVSAAFDGTQQLWIQTANSSLVCTLVNASFSIEFNDTNGLGVITSQSIDVLQNENTFSNGINLGTDLVEEDNKKIAYFNMFIALGNMIFGNISLENDINCVEDAIKGNLCNSTTYIAEDSTQTLSTGLIAWDEIANKLLARPALNAPNIFQLALACSAYRTLRNMSRALLLTLTTPNVYEYDNSNLLVSYSAVITVILKAIAFGVYSLNENGVYHDTSFSTFMVTTRNGELGTMAAKEGTCLGNVKGIKDRRLIFGVLTGGEGGGSREENFPREKGPIAEQLQRPYAEIELKAAPDIKVQIATMGLFEGGEGGGEEVGDEEMGEGVVGGVSCAEDKVGNFAADSGFDSGFGGEVTRDRFELLG